MPVSGELISIGDRCLCATVSGNGPVVVLNSGGGQAGVKHWAPITPELEEIATVIAYERAGLGWSDPPTAPPTVRDMAADLHALLLLRARTTISVAVVFAAFSSASAVAQPIGSVPAVGPIDHIMIRTGHPEALFTLFAETFELPVAWPLANRGGVTSGGVGFGNVNVEAITFPGQRTAESSLVGFAFEPVTSLSDSLAELDRRGVAYGNLRPFVITASDGAAATLWTNVTLSQLSDSDTPANATLHVFLSEYTPEYVDSEQRRERLRTVLAENDGGPMGVDGVVEVTVGTTNPAASKELWGELLSPQASSTDGFWTVGHGPSIRLVPAAEAAIQGLVIRVRSLGRAEAFLREQGLLGSVTQDVVTIAPNRVEGLRISLVENE